MPEEPHRIERLSQAMGFFGSILFELFSEYTVPSRGKNLPVSGIEPIAFDPTVGDVLLRPTVARSSVPKTARKQFKRVIKSITQ